MMLRFSLVFLLVLLIPVFGAAHQDARALQVDELEIKIGAEEAYYQGTLRVSIPKDMPGPVTALVILPFGIDTVTPEPRGIVDAKPELVYGDDSKTGLRITVKDTSELKDTSKAVIKFHIFPRPRVSENLPDSDASASQQKGADVESILERQDHGVGPHGGSQYILYFKLPHFPSSSALIPARVTIQLAAGVRESAPVNPARSEAVRPSSPSDGRRYDIDVPLFTEPWLGVTYELPLGDLTTPLRASLFTLLIVCVTLVPIVLVAMNSLIASVWWRIGAALGVWALAELSSPFLPAKVMDPTNRPVILITGILALLAIILYLVYTFRRQVAAVDDFPDDLSLVPLEELQKLRRRYQGHLARLQNQREDGGFQVSRLSDTIQQSKDRVRTIDKELARREQLTTAWNRSALRDLLTAAFNDEELKGFCFDHYPAVYGDFASAASKGQKIQALLEYCIGRERVQGLLDAVKSANPEQFQRFEGQLKQ